MSSWQCALLLLGGLGVFLHGMEYSASAFRESLGDRTRRLLASLGERKSLSFLFGILLSILSQSSTVAISFAVGLVDSGLLSLSGALVAMMGSSVGNAFIVLFLSLGIVRYAPVLLVASVLAARFGSREVQRWSKPLGGIALVLTGMFLIKVGVHPLISEPSARELLLFFSSQPILMGGAAFILTAMLQSSTAIMAMGVALAASGLLPLKATFPLVLGAYLGSSITVMLVGMGKRRRARSVAWGTFIYRLLGVVIALPLGKFYLGLAQRLSPLILYEMVYIQMAVALVNAALLLPFADLLSSLCLGLVPLEEEPGEPIYLDESLLPFPDVALALLSREAVRAANYLEELLQTLLCGGESDRAQNIRESLGDLLEACLRYLSSMAVPLEDERLRREYMNISYSLAMLKDMVEIVTSRLWPVAHALQGCDRLVAALLETLRNALGAFALGEEDFVRNTKASYERYIEEERVLRSTLVGAIDGAHGMKRLSAIMTLSGIAKMASELAGGVMIGEGREQANDERGG
ncbi:MAG TPA: Na/Pi symporter [Thermosynergistes sp.]|nr:Na/Pi symporter [Thermosynergistes sp.]